MNKQDFPSIVGSRILIVDDTLANLGVLQKMLESEGYQVFAATSGERALSIAGQFPPDLIILDVMMPGIGGLEACRRLKADKATQAIPVIFITALTDVQDIIKGFQAGAVDYVHKPFQHEEVCVRVRTHLQLCSYLGAYRSEADRLRAIVNNMGEGLLIISASGVIISVNPAAQHLLDVDPYDLQGMSILELLAAPYQEQYRHYFESGAGTSGRLTGLRHGPHEVQLSRARCEGLCLDLTITHIFSSEPMMVCLLHDISAHKRSHQELMQIACTDPLTGISNRRHFDSFLQQEWQRAVRGKDMLSLAILDVDHFKDYNDSLGHQAGDHCLQKVAAAIRSTAHRPTDLAARFGGEEFVLVLVNTDAEGAAKLANEACRAVQALDLPHPASSAAQCVTISGGVVTLVPDANGNIDDLLAAADAALYRAKAQGRNRIVRAD